MPQRRFAIAVFRRSDMADNDGCGCHLPSPLGCPLPSPLTCISRGGGAVKEGNAKITISGGGGRGNGRQNVAATTTKNMMLPMWHWWHG